MATKHQVHVRWTESKTYSGVFDVELDGITASTMDEVDTILNNLNDIDRERFFEREPLPVVTEIRAV